jgi:DNA-binding response OmpR family regulator
MSIVPEIDRGHAHPTPRVLVVEDHPDLRAALRETLAAEGYAVSEAEDGERALTLMSANHYDAAIVDVRMPRLDGFSVLEWMAERHIDCPVLLTSVVADAASRRRGEALGMFSFHQKPFVLGTLLSDLARAVTRGYESADHTGRPER